MLGHLPTLHSQSPGRVTVRGGGEKRRTCLLPLPSVPVQTRGIRERRAPRGTRLKSEKLRSKDLDIVEKRDKEERAERGQGKGQ